MSLLIIPASRLSQLTIDVSKDWGTHRITNLGAPAAAADLLSRRGTMDDMVDMALNKILVGQGATVDPVEQDLPSGDYPMKIKYAVVPRYVRPGWHSGPFINQLAVANRIYYMPIYVEELTTYLEIDIYSAGAAGHCDLRIFAWNAGLPGALIMNCGSVDTTGAGLKTIAINKQLTRGYYYLAARFDAGVSAYSMDPAGAACGPVPGIADATLTALGIIPYVDAAYADPAPAPTGITSSAFGYPFLREN